MIRPVSVDAFDEQVRLQLRDVLSARPQASSGFFPPETAIIVEKYGNHGTTVTVTTVVPVFNQVLRIRECLDSIANNVELPGRLIVVSDHSTDGTTEEVRRWMEARFAEPPTQGLVGSTLIIPERSLFETLCDTLGLAMCDTDYAIEVQADMFIREHGFDRRLLHWFPREPSLVMVSGRGGHTFARSGIGREPRRLIPAAIRQLVHVASRITKRYRPTWVEAMFSDEIGRAGTLIDLPAVTTDRLYLHESVMRGPLAIHLEKFWLVGGFDTNCFFLGNDDHDFCFRAWRDHRMRVGYTPVLFDSPLQAGTTRRKRTPAEQSELDHLNLYYQDAAKSSALARRVPDMPLPRRRVLH